MPSAPRPTARSRIIGGTLRKLREAKGFTIGTVARLTPHSAAWLSTVENGLQHTHPKDLAALLDFYEVPKGPQRDSLVHLAEHSRQKTWERGYEGRVSAGARDLAALSRTP